MNAKPTEAELKTYPIMDGPCVPWEVMAPHEKQAQTNHYQTLQRLSERGGLSAGEAWCVVNGIGPKEIPRDKVQWDALRKLWFEYAERINLHYAELARLTKEVEELRKAEKEVSDAYLRVRELLNAFNTNHGGENRFEVTENCIKELRKDKERLAADVASVNNMLKLSLEREFMLARELSARLDRNATMQKPIRASSDERLVMGESIKNEAGRMCGWCDVTTEHEHAVLKCTFCGCSGLSKNMVGHECKE